MNSLRRFLLALQFFTRIPVSGELALWAGYSPARLRESVGHLPGVGWVIGMAGALVFGLALTVLPGQAGAFAAALLCVIATVWLTGALHEDGLSDTVDGLGGTYDRERALEVMHDSRIGAFGALAVVLALGLKVALLAVLADEDPWGACVAVLVAQVLSRFAPLLVMRSLPYVGGETARAKPMADATSLASLWVGLAWSLPALLIMAWMHEPAHALLALVLAGLATWRMVRRLAWRLQGFTGDTLGATQQVCELALYLALAVRW